MVTDEHVAILRTFLKGDIEGHNEMFGQLDRESALAGYMPLLVASFFEAVDRRFGQNGTKADVVAFVGNIRTRSEELSRMDPRAAERLILAVFTDENADDIDDGTKGELYPIILAGLMADERLSDTELDEFLDEARNLAADLIATD